MAVVAFDIAAFRARYPEFNSVPDATLTAYFSEATIYCNNTDSSLISDVAFRATVLNMLTAHIGALAARTASAGGIVGRISQATEGSVSVSTEMTAMPNTAEWYAQTGYGMSYWQATAPFRTLQYRPGRSRPQRGVNPWLL